ncbi:MAG TPA: metalloregulator ArsR/SmtB family transcription factor [Anaerolineae bacterium]|nr:metalloregulator ArsR/SmtB family transcription factor [Anaerolineae bacterium]
MADETRLRIIRALLECPLTVGELTEVLDLPQSTVSRHLGVLRRGELVADRRDGTYIWYSLSEGLLHDEHLAAVVRAAVGRLAQAQADGERQAAVLEARRARTQGFFDALAGSYHNLAKPGGGAEGLAIAMAMALPPGTAIDLGAGEGDITLALARLGHRVIAVDAAPAMLRTLEARACAAGLRNVEAQGGELEALPLATGLGDLVLLSQTLHHTRRPEVALREAARVARPGGRVVVLDLLRHEQEWVRERLGDLWLGFEPAALQAWLAAAGLGDVVVETVEVPGGLPLLAGRGTKGGN